jgi:sugar/nucleoside kinase (ribokinase family)
MTSPQVFCYGEIGVDCIIQVEEYPRPHNAVFPNSESCHPGGSALTSAVWLANLGMETVLGGNCIGDDPFGKLIMNLLQEFPCLNSKWIQQKPGAKTPYNRVLVTPDAERAFLIFGSREAEKPPLTEIMLRGVTYLALDLYGGEERAAAAILAHSLGICTVVSDIIDPGHPVLPFTSVAVISAAYLRAKMPGVDTLAHARRLQSVSHGTVLLTDGRAAVTCLEPSGRMFAVLPSTVDTVDSTGCGDAFRAGLIYGLIQELNIEQAVCLAVSAGSYKVQHLGGSTTLPAAGEIERFAGKLKIDEIQG